MSETFGKQLAHTGIQKVRDKAVKALSEYILGNGAILSELDFLKLWKGLFYCFWMSDKPLIQQELAEKLSKLLQNFNHETGLKYLCAFWSIIVKEWYGIDRLRLDKFYMLLRKFHESTFLWLASNNWDQSLVLATVDILKKGPLSVNTINVPDSLRYHTIEVFFTQLSTAIQSIGSDHLNASVMTALFDPFVEMLKLSDNKNILDNIFSNILDLYIGNSDLVSDDAVKEILPTFISCDEMALILYELPHNTSALSQNRKKIASYLKKWGQEVGVPFVDKMAITGFQVCEIDIPFDSEAIRSSIKRKVKSQTEEKEVDDWELIEKADIEGIDSSDNSQNESPEERKKPKIVAESHLDETTLDSNELKAEPLKNSANKNLSKGQLKKLRKKERIAKLKAGTDFQSLLDQVDTTVIEKKQDLAFNPVQESVSLTTKKTVSWGAKHVKPFFKKSVICTLEEAQKSPTIKSSAPKVLKKSLVSLVEISKTTIGARKSPRTKAADFL